MKVAVIGAGIGGLTTALSLHAAGIPCEVYEATADILPLGVGINVLPHAVRELTDLGLAPRLAKVGIETECLMYANMYGQEIWREPRGRGAGYNWPQYSLHRGALQMMLLDAVKARIGGDKVHADHELAGFDVEAESATAHFRSRLTGVARGSVRADVIAACDGIHSAARRKLYPDEGAPIWNGRILWRGVTESEPFLGGRTMIMAGFQHRKFVCYPIDPATSARGRSMTNWIAELTFPVDHEYRREDWNRRGRLEDFLPQFEDWKFDWLDVPKLIRDAEVVYEYPLVDRDPVESWTSGRLTLLGDAAHPMYPIGSNGASQAILDARTFAFELAQGDSPDAAIARYEAQRRPPTSKIVMANRGNGPEQVMQLAHERAPNGFADLDAVISKAERDEIAANYKRLAGFDKEALSTRPSLTAVRAQARV